MIKVLFFARIREQLATTELEIDFLAQTQSIALLRQQLVADRGESWAQVLGAENVIVAVNQTVVSDSHSLSDGDEVAFFPPVTGG